MPHHRLHRVKCLQPGQPKRAGGRLTAATLSPDNQAMRRIGMRERPGCSIRKASSASTDCVCAPATAILQAFLAALPKAAKPLARALTADAGSISSGHQPITEML
jgi:hypothetical protein